MRDPKYESLGYRLRASGSISTISLIWLFSALIGYIMKLTGVQSSLISAVLFLGNIATYVLLFRALKTENKAELLDYEKKNGLLKTLTILVIPFFVLIFISSLFGVLANAVLNGALNAETDESLIAAANLYADKVKYVTALVDNIFHNMNLVGLIAVKIYLDESKDKRLRTLSLATTIAVTLHFFCAIIKYLILYNSPTNTGSGFFDVLTTITVYASYFTIFFLFETRKISLKQDIANISELESIFDDES